MCKQIALFATLALCLMATTFAVADSETWLIVGTNNQSQVPCTPMAPCGEVNLNVVGNDATFTVTSLLNNYVFNTFGFNTSGIAVSLVTASGEVGAYSLGGSGTQDGWGTFQHIFDTGKNGGSDGPDCQNQGPGCTFMFQVHSSSALTLMDFEQLSTGGNGSGLFAGHLAAPGGNTGFVGNTQLQQIPEPASLSVMGTALFAFGAGLKRKLLKA
jgi:hypothetical protein